MSVFGSVIDDLLAPLIGRRSSPTIQTKSSFISPAEFYRDKMRAETADERRERQESEGLVAMPADDVAKIRGNVPD